MARQGNNLGSGLKSQVPKSVLGLSSQFLLSLVRLYSLDRRIDIRLWLANYLGRKEKEKEKVEEKVEEKERRRRREQEKEKEKVFPYLSLCLALSL